MNRMMDGCRGVYPPKTSGANPPNLIGHRSFMELDFSPWGTASAEGAKLRLPKARRPSRLGGLRERRKLPRGVWGGAPETVRILNISCQKSTFWDLLNLVFVNN